MAVDLYVSPTGSDSNAGTAASPFKTVQAASIVHVAPGTYQGGFTTSASGTASAHIQYVSDVPYGAKIVPSASGQPANGYAFWENKGSYVDIKGFEVNGTGNSASGWRI